MTKNKKEPYLGDENGNHFDFTIENLKNRVLSDILGKIIIVDDNGLEHKPTLSALDDTEIVLSIGKPL